MRNRVKKLVLALMLSFCASIYVFTTVNAEDWTIVSDITELKTQIALGGNIKLGADIALDEDVNTEKDFILDLNGRVLSTSAYSLTIQSDVTIQDSAGNGQISGNKTYMINIGDAQPGTLTLKSGTIINNKQAAITTRANGTFIMDGGTIAASGFTSYNYGRLVINGGLVYAQSGIVIRLNTVETSMEMNGGTVQTNGTNTDAINISRGEAVINNGKIIAKKSGTGGIIIFGNSKLTINYIDIESQTCALSGNGTVSQSEANYGGNVTLVINDGKFISETCGIYLPQPNSTTEINGGTFSGYELGAEIRAGKVDINGGTFISTNPNFEIKSNTNGSTASGAAIAVAQHTTKQELSLTIRGGTFNAATPISEANPEHNNAEAIAKIKILVEEAEDGTVPVFNSTNGQMVYSEDIEKFITAGIYSHEINEKFIADNYTQEYVSGKYIVKKKIDKLTNPGTGDSLLGDIAVMATSVAILVILAINKISSKSSKSAKTVVS